MLTIVIVNFFSENLVKNCINSILSNHFMGDLSIVVVDNGSSTNILSELEQNNIKIIKNKKNKGFGTGCNLGFKNSNSKYILFLNPDTKVFKNTLSNAVRFLENNSMVSVLGCQQIDENSKVIKTCATHLTLKRYLIKSFYLDKLSSKLFKSHHMTYWSHTNSRYVEHVMGSFYMLRSVDFKKINGFDEDFFVYYEDLDLSKRIIDNGGKIFFNTDFKIYHETGGSSKNFKPDRIFYSLDATLTYARKHFSKVKYFILFFFILFIEPFLRILLSVLKLNLKETKQVFLAYKLLYLKRVSK